MPSIGSCFTPSISSMNLVPVTSRAVAMRSVMKLYWFLISPFALDALGPGDDEPVGDAAIMHDLFAILERRVPGHGPTRVIVRIGVGAAPFIIVIHVFLEGCLHAVDHDRFVIQAVQSAFTAGPVVVVE